MIPCSNLCCKKFVEQPYFCSDRDLSYLCCCFIVIITIVAFITLSILIIVNDLQIHINRSM